MDHGDHLLAVLKFEEKKDRRDNGVDTEGFRG